MSVFKHTSVVYMFPTQGDGRMLFDTDGDGQLTADDQSNSCLDLLDASVDFGKEPVDTMTRKSLKWKPDDVALEDFRVIVSTGSLPKSTLASRRSRQLFD